MTVILITPVDLALTAILILLLAALSFVICIVQMTGLRGRTRREAELESRLRLEIKP